MLALSVPRKPAPLLAMRGAMATKCVRPTAFGNALGGSIVDEMQPRQGVGPSSGKDYVNGADLESDQAASRREALYGLAGRGARLGDARRSLNDVWAGMTDESVNRGARAWANWDSVIAKDDARLAAQAEAARLEHNVRAEAYGRQLAAARAAKTSQAGAMFWGSELASDGAASFASVAASGPSAGLPYQLGAGGRYVPNYAYAGPDAAQVPLAAPAGVNSNFLGTIKGGVLTASGDLGVWGDRRGGVLGSLAYVAGGAGFTFGTALPGSEAELAFGMVAGPVLAKGIGLGAAGLNSLAARSSLTSWAAADLTVVGSGAASKFALAFDDAKKTFNYDYRHWFSGRTTLEQPTTFYSYKNPTYFKPGTDFAPLELWMTPTAMPADQAVSRLALPYSSGYDAMLTVTLPAGTTIVTPRTAWSLFGKPGGGIETRSYSPISADMYTVGKPPVP